jgi:hypothetical protein
MKIDRMSNRHNLGFPLRNFDLRLIGYIIGALVSFSEQKRA